MQLCHGAPRWPARCDAASSRLYGGGGHAAHGWPGGRGPRAGGGSRAGRCRDRCTGGAGNRRIIEPGEFQNVSFSVRAGEVVGFRGAGRCGSVAGRRGDLRSRSFGTGQYDGSRRAGSHRTSARRHPTWDGPCPGGSEARGTDPIALRSGESRAANVGAFRSDRVSCSAARSAESPSGISAD